MLNNIQHLKLKSQLQINSPLGAGVAGKAGTFTDLVCAAGWTTATFPAEGAGTDGATGTFTGATGTFTGAIFGALTAGARLNGATGFAAACGSLKSKEGLGAAGGACGFAVSFTLLN